MTLQQAEVVFSSADVEVRHSHLNSDMCFVTFTSLGRAHVHGFGERFLQPRGVSAFHFVSKWDHWYQPASVRQGAEIVKALIRQHGYSRVVTYGASMGGFGAAAFSGVLEADAVIMIAPQYTIDSTKPPYERRWIPEARKIEFLFDDLAHQIRPEARKTVVFDPYSLDRPHAELFAQAPNTEQLHIPFGGHTPGRVLLHCGLLQDMTLQLATGTFDKVAFYAQLHRGRRKSNEWWSVLSDHAQRRRPDAKGERTSRLSFAYKAAEEAMRLAPAEATQVIQGVYLLGRLGRAEEALALARRAVEMKPDHPAPWRALSLASRLNRAYGPSIEAARKAVSLRRNDADLQRVLVECLLHAKQYDDAVPEARRAIELDPKYAQSYVHLATSLAALGQASEAAEALEQALVRRPGVAAWMAQLEKLRARQPSASAAQ